MEGERTAPGLSIEDRRWLHDKYERLANAEAQLSDSRTSYFAAIAAAMVAALVLLAINELHDPPLFVTAATLLALFGILISSVWALVLYRTTAAQNLWRSAALELERFAPPVPSPLPVRLPIRRGVEVTVDLSRPYHAHLERFSPKDGIPWPDRVRPSELAAEVPLLLVGLWTGVLAVIWIWYIYLI